MNLYSPVPPTPPFQHHRSSGVLHWSLSSDVAFMAHVTMSRLLTLVVIVCMNPYITAELPSGDTGALGHFGGGGGTGEYKFIFNFKQFQAIRVFPKKSENPFK